MDILSRFGLFLEKEAIINLSGSDLTLVPLVIFVQNSPKQLKFIIVSLISTTFGII